MSGSSSSNVEHAITCYLPDMVTTNGINQGDNPFDYSMPLFLLQITLVVVSTRVIIFLLRPFRQPRVVAEILSGFILGPSVLGHFTGFTELLFPLRSVMVLETVGNIGLLYFLFIVGVEMDLSVIKRSGRKGISIAIGSMILPFIIGCGFTSLLPINQDPTKGHLPPTYILFLGITLSVTTFPVLARVLADIKLINTEIGQIAMSSALINDLSAWILLIFAIALSGTNGHHLVSLWVILSCTAVVVISFFVVRPLILRMIRKTPEGETISDFNIYLILTGVMISGFVTDAIGTHSTVGAFIFGLIIPNGFLGVTLIEKVEDCVSGLLLPLYFIVNGLKTDITKVVGIRSWFNLLIVIILAYTSKVIGTAAASHFYSFPLREGIILGLLMNTKGLVELIVLNIGREQQALDEGTFSIMVVAVVLMTGTVGPIVNSIYQSGKGLIAYKRRSLQTTKQDSELRILSCIHTSRNVPTMLNLLEITHQTKKSPLCVYVLHLIELTGRASAMVIVHNPRKSNTNTGALNRTQAQSEHIFSAFEGYEKQEQGYVDVQPLTAISPHSSMHEDICSLAEDKKVAIIILPFHKQPTVDGGMESTNPEFQSINQNMLANAPCSVGILVDRGLNRSLSKPKHVIVLFFSGRDDREALAYGLRMADNEGVALVVIRFIPNDSGAVSVAAEAEQERKLDEETLSEFREKTGGYESVTFVERAINNGDEIVGFIRSIDPTMYDLYVVGRGQGVMSPLTIGLSDWSECPELGPIGDLLVSSNLDGSASVLVLQQYAGLGIVHDNRRGGFMSPVTPFAVTGDHDKTIFGKNVEGYDMNKRR